jgi:hypothetical protein
MKYMLFKISTSTFIIILFFIGCNTSKIPFYKYTTNIYSIDTVYGKNLAFSNCFISCDKFLFEFIVKTKNKKEVIGDELVSNITTYDTIGVYILSAKTKQYFEFDTFALTSNLVKKGLIKNKESGNGFSFSENTGSAQGKYGPIKDTFINSIHCYVAEIILNEKVVNDSLFQQVFLLKQPNLNTRYKFDNFEFFDKTYAIVGFNKVLKKHKQTLVDEVIDFRILTEKERTICTSMLKKVGLQ